MADALSQRIYEQDSQITEPREKFLYVAQFRVYLSI